MTSATSKAQLAARQSESEAILRRLVSKWDSTQMPALLLAQRAGGQLEAELLDDSATPRFYRLLWTVFDAYARDTRARYPRTPDSDS
jgi:hypothetical protein